jgi:dipeptidyl aminopeptidase/acylaminoacyl peptidase
MRRLAAAILVAAACGGGRAVPATHVRVEGGLTFDGMPALDVHLADRLHPFLEARAAELVDVAADGALLVTTRFADTRQLHRVDRAGGDRVQLTFAREPIAQGRWVPGVPGAFLMLADGGGDERLQIWRVDGGAKVRLTDGESRNVAPLWSPDGATLVWASTARDGVDFDLWRSDGATAASATLLHEATGTWTPVDFSADGGALLCVETRSTTRAILHRLELATGTMTRVSDEDDVATTDARWGPGGRIYAISDRAVPGAARRPRLWEIAADGGWRVLTAELDADVERVEVAPGGATVAFTTNVAGASELHVLDVEQRRHERVAAVPDGAVIGAMRFVPGRDQLALSWSSATEPGDVAVYDLVTKQLVRWTRSELGGLDPAALVTPTAAVAAGFDGTPIALSVYAPAAGGAAPVVLALHGGPESQWRPRFQPDVQYLVSLGYAVVEPDVRGSTGHGRDFTMLDDTTRRGDAVRDVGAVLDWIATRPELDATRVAVLGASYGGFLALASLVAHGGRLRAGVDVVGISSLATFLAGTSPYRRALRRAEYGDERDPAVRAVLDELSPLTHAAEIHAPLFVVQGGVDPRVPSTEAAQIVDAVRAGGRDVWYLTAADEGHGFQRREDREAQLVATAQFLREFL